MKFEGNITGAELIEKLKRYGYSIQKQVGNQVRIHTSMNGGHKITILYGEAFRKGTFSDILSEIASHLKKDKKALIGELFDENNTL